MDAQNAVVKLSSEIIDDDPEQAIVLLGGLFNYLKYTKKWELSSCLPYSRLDDIAARASLFKICINVPGIIAAGGCVSRVMDFNEHPANKTHLQIAADASSDLDLYVRANDRESALRILDRLRVVLEPVGEVSMTEFAISFDVKASIFKDKVFDSPSLESIIKARKNNSTTEPVYRIQVIRQTVPDTCDICKDIETLIGNYDLSCCSFATDGHSVYATEAAVKAVYKTRLVHVDWSRIIYLDRLLKYHKRGFDFEIHGPRGEVLLIDRSSRVASTLMKSLFEYGDLQQPLEEIKTPMHGDNYERTSRIFDSATSVLSKMLYFDDFDRLSYGVVCGDACDWDHVLRTGKCAESHVQEWKYTAMNSFCDELMSFKLSDEDNSKAIAAFATRIENFISLTKTDLSVTPIFSDMHNTVSTFKTDFDTFVQDWCVPAAREAGGEESPAKRCKEVNMIQRDHFTHASPLRISDYSHSTFGSGMCFYLERADAHGVKFELDVPEMELPCGIPVYHSGHRVPQNKCDALLMSFGTSWQDNQDLCMFRQVADDMMHHCAVAIMDKMAHRPYLKDEMDVQRAITPIVVQNSFYNDVEKIYPPSMRVHVADQSRIAVQGQDKLVPLDPNIGLMHIFQKKSHAIKARVCLDWVYRRCLHKTFRFTTHWTIVNAIITNPNKHEHSM